MKRRLAWLLPPGLALLAGCMLDPFDWFEDDPKEARAAAEDPEEWDALAQAREARNPVYIPPWEEDTAVDMGRDLALELVLLAALALLLALLIRSLEVLVRRRFRRGASPR